jgi:hyperosmotically inducible protein
MIRTFFRTILLVVIVVAIAAFFFGYRWAARDRIAEPDQTIGTTGGAVDVERARDAAADIGATVAKGANRAQAMASSAVLTAKIKSKMALDDTIDATAIDVDTAGSVVTLSGTVGSRAEHERALQLARETDGVTSVVDRLVVK